MIYYLLQHGETEDENTLHAYYTEKARDLGTIKCIFGEYITTPDEIESWVKMRADLIEKGELTFEGDPGIEWFTATPDLLNHSGL